jgi:hypothetical protein
MAEDRFPTAAELHAALDLLVAQWIEEGGLEELRLPSKATVLELIEWSAYRVRRERRIARGHADALAELDRPKR